MFARWSAFFVWALVAASAVANRPAGRYELTETAAPAGYQLNGTPVAASLAWGSTVTLTVEDQPLASMRVLKVDGVNGDPVPGAALELTGPSPSTAVVWSGVSGTAPIDVPGLVAGTYTLTETAAPAGFHLASPVSTTVGWGETGTISLDNFLIVGGRTTASEVIGTSDGTVTEVYDEVTLTGVHADQEVSVTAVLYAADHVDGDLTVDLADNICAEGNEVERITVTVTGPGPHRVGPFHPPADGFRGVWTFADGVTGDGPQVWLDHCGQPEETVVWLPPIEGQTVAMDVDPATGPADDTIGEEIVSIEGAQVWDRVEVTGLATGETATIIAVLYADPTVGFPFDQPFSANACVEDNRLGEPVTITVTGTNDAATVDVFHIGPFPIPQGSQGRVSFYDTVTSTVTTGDDRTETRVWSATCGDEDETLTVRAPFTGSTSASRCSTIR